MRLGEEAARAGQGNGEWSGAQAQYALAIALINAGRREAGREAMAQACGDFSRLDARPAQPAVGLRGDGRGWRPTAATPPRPSDWADRAAKVAGPGQEATARLARAHALRGTRAGAAATAAAEAAQLFDGTGLLIDAGRARLCAGVALRRGGR